MFECRHDHPRHWVNPHEAIFDSLDAGNPFGSHADRTALTLIEQCARKVHDSVEVFPTTASAASARAYLGASLKCHGDGDRSAMPRDLSLHQILSIDQSANRRA